MSGSAESLHCSGSEEDLDDVHKYLNKHKTKIPVTALKTCTMEQQGRKPESATDNH